MVDIVLETFRAIILFGIVLFLLKTGRSRARLSRNGWKLIVSGFALLLFASLLDITDNFESLGSFVVIGDTEVEAFLEKIVGFLGGFILLALGLVRWIPGVQQLSEEVAQGKQAEEALRESERHTTLLMNSVPALISYTDREKRFQFNNKAYEDLLGRSVGELRGARVEEVLGDTAYQVAKPHIEMALAGQRSRFENVIVNHMGEQRIIDVSYVPDFDEAGTVNGFIALIVDITERKRADLALRRQALVLEQMSDGVIVTDLEGKIIDWNPGAERMFGYAKDEMLGETPGVLHRPTEAEHLTAKMIEGMNRYGRWVGEITFIRKDGTEGICEMLVVPFYDERGEQVATIGVTRDITERKQAENALRAAHDTLEQRVRERTVELEREITERERAQESLQRAEFALDHASDATLWLDRDGRAVYANNATFAILGYSRDELLRLCVTDYDPDASPEDFARAFKRIKAHGPSRFEARHRNKDGKYIPVEVSIHYMQFGDREFVCSYFRDITDRKRAEEALRDRIEQLEEAQRKLEQQGVDLVRLADDLLIARDEARAADRAKSEFLAAMSHELRTPLNAIIGFSEVIKKETFGPVGSVKYREYTSDIHESGQHLLGLINDILDLSKIESGTDELHEENIEIPTIIRSALTMVQGRIERDRTRTGNCGRIAGAARR